MEDVLASPVYHDLMTPKLAPGDAAYRFELPRDDGELVRLADYAGRMPVALVFGSYT
jgi:peroxiredoxin